MKTETVKIYSCEHCYKISRNPGAMAVHEKYCKKNPSNINACVGCKFLEVDTDYDVIDTLENGYHVQRIGMKLTTFSCSKLNKEMYPSKVKNKIKKYPDSFEGKVQMPNSCEHHEQCEDSLYDEHGDFPF